MPRAWGEMMSCYFAISLAEVICCICAFLPTESWHHIKAFITGDMLIANFQKNHRVAVNVSFVYK